MKYIFRKIKHFFLTILVLGYILFEKVIWDYIAAPVYKYIHGKEFFKRFINYVEHKASRELIMFYFLTFFAIAEGMGAVAMALLGTGHIILFAILYILKIPPAIVSFAILNVGKDKLVTYTWFRKIYSVVLWIIDKIKSTSIYGSIMRKAKYFRIKAKKEYLNFKEAYFSEDSDIMSLVKSIYKKLKRKGDQENES